MAKQSDSREVKLPPESAPPVSFSRFARWIPLLLAMVAFFAYWPSLKSDFVYDARIEILDEGFITSLTNLSDVLSLKVLGMHLTLGPRPGQLLYLMLIAAVCGKEPFGYHLCSNLLHATNVALLFVLLRWLMAAEVTGLDRKGAFKAQLAAAVVTLVFALHPIATETVAAVNYSSDLLVAFFTLLALLAASSFRPGNIRVAVATGIVGTLSAFAAVTCKESGIAASLLLIVYWFLFRRQDAKGSWLWFLGGSVALSTTFLLVRFSLAPLGQDHLSYLGGSFSQVFLIQPKLWLFMMGQLLWPVHLSADYTLENMNRLSTVVAFAVLFIVLALQGWLSAKSRLGGLGVAVFWLGLATVSNFVPLNRILADRFYYLPMAGVAMQILALLLMILKYRRGFWMAMAALIIVILPLARLTLIRQEVFANEFNLWSDTLLASPFSSTASNDLGVFFFHEGRLDEAIVQSKKALEIDPNFASAHINLGNALFQKSQLDEAMAQYQEALSLNPAIPEAHKNLGEALFQKGRIDEAMAQYQKELEINPNKADVHSDLGVALYSKGKVNEAIAEFKEALRLKPDLGAARFNLMKIEAATSEAGGAK